MTEKLGQRRDKRTGRTRTIYRIIQDGETRFFYMKDYKRVFIEPAEYYKNYVNAE